MDIANFFLIPQAVHPPHPTYPRMLQNSPPLSAVLFSFGYGASAQVTYSAKSFKGYMLNIYLFSSMRLEGDDERFKIKHHHMNLYETRRVMRKDWKPNIITGVGTLCRPSNLKLNESSRCRWMFLIFFFFFLFLILIDWCERHFLRLHPREDVENSMLNHSI